MARRRKTSSKASSPENGLPLAISPEGVGIHRAEHLPVLPLPKKVVVSENVLRVDGWHIRLWPMGQKFMDWFGRQVAHWYRLDPSPANKEQVIGEIDALETMIRKKLEQPIQGEFEF